MAKTNGTGTQPPPKMLTVECDLVGKSPISWSAPIQSKRDTGEAHDDFEGRTWRERLWVNSDGHAFIPPMALKNCLSQVARHLSETVPGKGKATYTKHFVAGIMVTDPLVIEPHVTKDAIEGERIFVPSDGKRGGGTRVWKTFPVVRTWRTHAVIHLLDPILTAKPEKVEEYLAHAGNFIGMLRFRPANNGYYGRFNVENFSACTA